MNLTKNITDIYKVLISDETLLRLLYYPQQDALDDPLDESKPNILDNPNKWEVINDVICCTRKVDDLVDVPKNRLFVYPGNRRSVTNNYLIARQQIIFDVLTHISFDRFMRSTRICDRINELICNTDVTGIGKVLFISGSQIGAPEGWVGYRLIYEIGSGS